MLVNQFTILSLVDTENGSPEHYRRAAEIFKRGYTDDYDSVFGLEEEVPAEVCEEVKSILDMFRALNVASIRLPSGSVDFRELKFQGFDLNNEDIHFGYAKFLLEEKGMWSESNIAEMNSHRPMLHQYRQMMWDWKACEKKWELTLEEVMKIASHV